MYFSELRKTKRFAISLVNLVIFSGVFIIFFGVIFFIASIENDTVESAKVINGLRLLKSVAVSYYLDNPDGPAPQIDPDLKPRMEAQPDSRFVIDDFSSDIVYAYFDLSGMSSGIV